MRTKTLEMDGVDYRYSPLNLQQAEEIVQPLGIKDDEPARVKNKAYREWVIQIVAHGLNNALLDEEGNLPAEKPAWTTDRVRLCVDQIVLDKLIELILDESKLRKTADPKGEGVAAGDSISPKSAA